MNAVRPLIFILWGAFAGLLEAEFTLPFLCIISMMPLFWVAFKCKASRFLPSVIPFLAAYDFTKSAFLLTVYRLLDYNPIVEIFISVAAALAVTLILLLSQLVCLSFFGNIKTGKPFDLVTISLLFSASEWLCENLGAFSFPWLGVWAQADGAMQIFMTAGLLGCRFTSFLILLANGILYLSLSSLLSRKIISGIKHATVCFVLAAAVFAYGEREITVLNSIDESSPTLSVLCVQLDCEGYEKTRLGAERAAKKYAALIEQAIENYGTADIVFLPETAVNTAYSETSAAFLCLESLAERYGCTIVTGCFYKQGEEKFNSAVVITPSGVLDTVYSKAHLVPFGEYTPFSSIFGGRTLSYRKEKAETLEASNVKIACGICIESIYSDLFAQQVKSGAQLIYIPTNDSWFSGTCVREAHFVHSKMRAVENYRYTVRAGNCGISAVISPTGEEIARLDLSISGAIFSQVSLISKKSFYSCVGDIFMLLPLSLALYSTAKFLSKVKESLIKSRLTP